ncbi:hypothetical protein TRVL_10362 [Trypanosoma vivax]|nr:hypothetical protein TRVL_10362 [Trypanosoma vivax]
MPRWNARLASHIVQQRSLRLSTQQNFESSMVRQCEKLTPQIYSASLTTRVTFSFKCGNDRTSIKDKKSTCKGQGVKRARNPPQTPVPPHTPRQSCHWQQTLTSHHYCVISTVLYCLANNWCKKEAVLVGRSDVRRVNGKEAWTSVIR